MSRACILGCLGTELSPSERDFFRETKPWGFILFARNVVTAEQTRALTDQLREAVDDPGALVFVDQEGGRVQRLKPPLALRRRPAEQFGELYARDPEAAREAVRLNHRLLAYELMSVGLDADCAPCLDIRYPQTHAIIGDRAFGSDAAVVADLGKAAVEGLLAGGVAPVIKHIPGHGRAMADSHLELPVVDTPREELERTDFAPFRALRGVAMAMTAHVVYSAVDGECLTWSRKGVDEVIRGSIGFDGLLMSDDLSMRALGGTFEERSRRAIDAGCDVVLHGNGALVGEHAGDLMGEFRAIVDAVPELTGKAAERAAEARRQSRRADAFDPGAAEERLAAVGLEGRAAA